MKMCVFLAAVVASLVFASGALADSLHCAHGADCGTGSIGGGISSGSGGRFRSPVWIWPVPLA